jgi:hypothetical protein
VLLLSHPLAPLLDDRTHVTTLILLSRLTGMSLHMLATSGSRAHANATAYLRRGASSGIARHIARSARAANRRVTAVRLLTISQSSPTYASLR